MTSTPQNPAKPGAARRSHPVVDRYVTTDLRLTDIIRQTAAPSSPTLLALLAIEESLEGQKLARDAIRLAQEAPIKGADPELLILMLSSWADLSCRIGRPSEADTLVHRAKSLVSETTHPEVAARATYVASLLAETTGDKAGSETLLREIVSAVPPFSPRRKFYVWDVALLLALQGRGRESEFDIKELVWQCNEQFPLNRISLVRFVNAVETGNVLEAAQLAPQAEGAVTSRRDAQRVPLKGYYTLLKLMQGGRMPSGTDPVPPHEFVRVAVSLLANDTDAALKLARIEADKLGALFGSGFRSFDLIRAELAAGNGVAAGRLLKMRRSRGNTHYLDDVFLARIDWHAGNRRSAARHFATALETAEHHAARGRLDFELRLACELSQGDVVELTRLAEGATRRAPEPASVRLGAPSRSITDVASAAPTFTVLGRSDAMNDVRSAINRFADLDAPILITGETGVGKEMVARALHQASRRRDEPFTAVNCGSITETLLESELFGHEKGAFTGAEKASEGLFAATGKGTILLDEIGDVSPRLQATLLRVLETGEVRAVGSTTTRKIACRIVAATNADIGGRTEAGSFRRDLLFRLQRLGIHIPPLRDRREDILLLVRHFLDLGRPIGVHADISPELRKTVSNYDWPGNIRELRNVIERMRLLHSDKLSYNVDDLDLKFQSHAPTPIRLRPPAPAVNTAEEPQVQPASQSVAEMSEGRPGAGPTPPAPPGQDDVAAILLQGRSPMRRLDRLRELFRVHGKLTRSEAIRILDISPNTATKDLRLLCEEGTIRRVEPSASSRSFYFERVNPDDGAPQGQAEA